MSEFLGYPSDCMVKCCQNKALVGFAAKTWVNAKCNDINMKFLGVATSTISQEDALQKARADALARAERWYEATACYAKTHIDIVIGGGNL